MPPSQPICTRSRLTRRPCWIHPFSTAWLRPVPTPRSPPPAPLPARPVGNYAFNITQLATAAQINGATGVSQSLVPDGNPADVTIGTAGFATPVTAGTFTVNGAQMTIATTDSLQQVFNNIASATQQRVTASYDSTTDNITLTSSDGSPITLGSATDTSNFLQVAQLYNNNGGTSTNTGTITSTSALGHVKLSATLANAGLENRHHRRRQRQRRVHDQRRHFNYNASTDSLQDMLNNINESAAGVSASYDSVNNRFMLANNTTGDVGISMQDVTGSNFLAATGPVRRHAELMAKSALYLERQHASSSSASPIPSTARSSGINGLDGFGAEHRHHHGECQLRHRHHQHRHPEICHGLQYGPVLHHQPAGRDHGGGRHGDARHAHRRHQPPMTLSPACAR